MKKHAITIAIVLTAAVVTLELLLPSPVAVIKNVSSTPVTVRLDTDVGDFYTAGTIAPFSSIRRKIGGGDKLIWAVAEFPDGRVKQSQKLYVTTLVTVSVVINDEAVEATYELSGRSGRPPGG